ncbi:MAG TPA: RNA 2',3'-cyclic phosphodiesterase [Terriglobales bacterium]|nr:RNA 2',3'-cyclic phosphodiesterase [Terriglobales bacterium]
MRLFVAVFPPSEVQRAAHRVIETLRRPDDGVSWVKLENLHYTMRFLGEVGDDGARRIAEAAIEAASRSSAFEAALGGLGAFPSARRARVIWIGMSAGAEALVTLARDLDRALDKRGFAPEGRPFSAHLTLGRVRAAGPDWTATLAGAPVESPPRFTVDRLCVVRSQLNPRGSIYTIQADPRLGVGRPPAAP